MFLRWLEVVVEFFEVVLGGCRSLLLSVTTVCYRLCLIYFPGNSFVSRNK